MDDSRESPVDLCVISDHPGVIARAQAICAEFGYSHRIFPGVEAFLDSPPREPRLIFAAISAAGTSVAEIAQGIRYVNQGSFLATTVSGTLAKDQAVFAKKSGADLILLEEEVLETSKLEFVCTQVIRASFLPVKGSDLNDRVPLRFDLYHLLAQRGKFLPAAFSGDVIEPRKLQKCVDVGELYVPRAQAFELAEYVREANDLSAAGLARRCRVQFLALFSSYVNLVLLLTDQSEHSSFAEGQQLLKKCRELSAQLLAALGEFGNAADVINQSAIGELGSVERATAIAAHTAVFGLQIGLPNIDQLMLNALLVDLGLVLLRPGVGRTGLDGDRAALSSRDRQAFEGYPAQSLELALNHKLPVDEKQRQVLLATQEWADGTGFPRGLVADRIAEGAQLIHFARLFDRRTLCTLGKERVTSDDAVAALLSDEAELGRRFSAGFIRKLKEAFA